MSRSRAGEGGTSPVLVKEERECEGGTSPVLVKEERECEGGTSPLLVKEEQKCEGGMSPVLVKEERECEGSMSPVLVKEEREGGMSPAVLVKAEREWESAGECGASEAAAAGLYPDHEVKGELVLGPEQLKPQDIAYALRQPQNRMPTRNSTLNTRPAPSAVNQKGPASHLRGKRNGSAPNVSVNRNRLAANLRGKRKATASDVTANQSEPLVFKRLRIPDWDSDEAPTSAKRAIVTSSPVALTRCELTTLVKERRFRTLMEMFLDISPMFIRNTLVKCAWNEERSRDELLKYDLKSNDRASSSSSFQGSRAGPSGQVSQLNQLDIVLQNSDRLKMQMMDFLRSTEEMLEKTEDLQRLVDKSLDLARHMESAVARPRN